MTFAEKVINFNDELKFDGLLPKGFAVLNPYHDNPETLKVMREFYFKFYHDNIKRKFLIGINPSRNGAGVTGVPFTDTKRLKDYCGITMETAKTHEISSVFMYDMINAYSNVVDFYHNFYINSPFPLAIIRKNNLGNWVNANYYDDPALYQAVKPFMISSLKAHIGFGVDCNTVYILGKKNAIFLDKINSETNLFNKTVVLEHPRFIQQYKSKERLNYIMKYINLLNNH